MYWQFEEKPVSIRVERESGCNQFGWVRLLSQRSQQEMVNVSPCRHFVLDCVLHCTTLWGTLYWTVCYTVLPFWDIVYRTVCLTVPPDVVWILIMLFADDVLLASYCVAGLQRQIDVLKYFADLFYIFYIF